MGVGRIIGQVGLRIDKRFGIQAWLKGEPRPPAGGFDLDGEKNIDWGWICANLPRESKKALEIGCGTSPILPAMLSMGYEVVGVDLDAAVSRQISGFTFVHGDFNHVDVKPGFDVVIACSAIEHFGLSGRYGSPEDGEGDIKAMGKIATILNPSGLLFLTIPVGADAV